MKFIYEYLDVKAPTAEETAQLLTNHVQEVDKVEHHGVAAKGVVTGKVMELKRHPNADRLRIATVDIGKQVLDIITGAPNIAVNQIVAVALPGAQVVGVDHKTDNPVIDRTKLVTIEETVLRGIKSPGMVCGPDELGLSDKATKGLHIFPDNTPLGQPVEKVILSRTIIETDDKGTAHRPDLLSYSGIEQELAAILDKPYSRPDPTLPTKKPGIRAVIEASDACSLLLIAKLDHFSTFSSPQWLKDFLTAHDIKVINLPTDATNYVMLKEGGTSHAFGAESIIGNTVKVRLASSEEKISVLNGKTYALKTSDLVIADQKKALDIAGIIGGNETGVKDTTKSIILTAAVFEPSTIRRTGRRLGIRTEALVRRERGQSAAMTINAFNKIVEILRKEAGATVTAVDYAGNPLLDTAEVEFELSHLNRFLGTALTLSATVDILKRLNYQVEHAQNTITVTVPWWRNDLRAFEDVAEDIARIYGYSRIAQTVPHLDNTASSSKLHLVVERLRAAATETMYEVQSSSMVEKGDDSSIEIRNPIGEKRFIRQTLLPGLFKLAEHFAREGYDHYRAFEIGKTYRVEGKNLTEKWRFGAVMLGDIEEAKQVVGTLLHRLHIPIDQIRFDPCPQSEDRAIRYDAVAKIFFKDTLLGNICVNTKRNQTYVGFKLYIEPLVELATLDPVFKPYSKFPFVKRDLAFILTKQIALGAVVESIKAHSNLLADVSLFDRFTDRELGENNQSVAFHLTFQSPSRTLTDAEVNEIMQAIERNLKEKFKVKIRE